MPFREFLLRFDFPFTSDVRGFSSGEPKRMGLPDEVADWGHLKVGATVPSRVG